MVPDRDSLGKLVREVWIEWAKTQPHTKPSWLVPYGELSEADKEADRMIGTALWLSGRASVIELGAMLILDDMQARALDTVRLRLYDDRPLSGDQRRDLANKLDAIMSGAIRISSPQE